MPFLLPISYLSFIGRAEKIIFAYKIPSNWQIRFCDRIIRNADEMNCVADYIDENVAIWGLGNDDF